MTTPSEPKPNLICRWLEGDWAVSLQEQGGKLSSRVSSLTNPFWEEVVVETSPEGFSPKQIQAFWNPYCSKWHRRIVSVSDSGALSYDAYYTLRPKIWPLGDREIILLQSGDSLVWQLFNRITKDISRLNVDFERGWPLERRCSFIENCDLEAQDLTLEGEKLKAIKLPIYAWLPVNNKNVYSIRGKDQVSYRTIDVVTQEEGPAVPDKRDTYLPEKLSLYEPYIKDGRFCGLLRRDRVWKNLDDDSDTKELSLLYGNTLDERNLLVWHRIDRTRQRALQTLVTERAPKSLDDILEDKPPKPLAETTLTKLGWFNNNYQFARCIVDDDNLRVRPSPRKSKPSQLDTTQDFFDVEEDDRLGGAQKKLPEKLRARVDGDNWAVTLCSLGHSRDSDSYGQFGHAIIVIEGIANGRFFTHYAHLTGSGTILSEDRAAFERYAFEPGEKSPTYIRSREAVQAMLKSIRQEIVKRDEKEPQVFFDERGSDRTACDKSVKKFTTAGEFFQWYRDSYLRYPREKGLLSPEQIIYKQLAGDKAHTWHPSRWEDSLDLNSQGSMRVVFSRGSAEVFVKPDNCLTWAEKKLSFLDIKIPPTKGVVAFYASTPVSSMKVSHDPKMITIKLPSRETITLPSTDERVYLSVSAIKKSEDDASTAEDREIASRNYPRFFWELNVVEQIQSKFDRMSKEIKQASIPRKEWHVDPAWTGVSLEVFLAGDQRIIVPIIFKANKFKRQNIDITEEVHNLFSWDSTRPPQQENLSIFDGICRVHGDQIEVTDISELYKRYLLENKDDRKMLRKLFSEEVLGGLKALVLEKLRSKKQPLADATLMIELFSNDADVILETLGMYEELLPYASKELQENHAFALLAIGHNSRVLNHISKTLKKNREFICEFVKQFGWKALRNAIELWKEWKGDRTVILAAVAQDINVLGWAHEMLRGDHKIMLEAIQRGGVEALKLADYALIGDPTFMLEAMKLDSKAFYYAHPILLGNPVFMVEAMLIGGLEILQHANSALKKTPAFWCEAALSYSRALKTYPALMLDAAWNDYRTFMLEAVQQFEADEAHIIVSQAHETLRDDREFMLEAIRKCEEAWVSSHASVVDVGLSRYASEALKRDPAFQLEVEGIRTLKAIKRFGLEAFIHARPALKKSPAFVLEVMQKYGVKALKYTDESLKRNHAFKLEVVQKFGIEAIKSSPLARDEALIAEFEKIAREAVLEPKGAPALTAALASFGFNPPAPRIIDTACPLPRPEVGVAEPRGLPQGASQAASNPPRFAAAVAPLGLGPRPPRIIGAPRPPPRSLVASPRDPIGSPRSLPESYACNEFPSLSIGSSVGRAAKPRGPEGRPDPAK